MSTQTSISTSTNATTTTATNAEAEATSALQVLVLTQHIHKYLKQHDPKALEQAATALRGTLPDTERARFEASLSEVSAEAEAEAKEFPKARITVHLPEGRWSHTTRDGQVTIEER